MMKNNVIKVLCVFILTTNLSMLKAQQDVIYIQNIDTLTISTESNSLLLLTLSYTDSLDENFKIGEKIYPKIVHQAISFTVDNIVTNVLYLDSLPINKQTKMKIDIQTLPILDISAYKGNDGKYYYFLYGGSLCCGVRCPEYFGLLDSNGKLLYESIDAKNYQYNDNFKSFDDFFRIKDIDYNSPLTKRSIY